MSFRSLQSKIGARLDGESEGGFTLIELLVVMLILGILAAIALPAFFNQKSKASDAKAKELAHTAQVAVETCSTDSASGLYTNCGTVANLAALQAIEPTLPSTGVVVTPTTGTDAGKGYTLTVTAQGGNTFSITRAVTGGLSYSCTTFGKGGCPASPGDWSK